MHKHEWNKIAEDVNLNLEIDLERFSSEASTSMRILDYGCGYGRISRLLWDSGYWNVVGIDSSIKMIERGKREFPKLHLDVTSDETLPFLDNSFDAVVACAVFTCITSKETRLTQIKELCRVLKPGDCYIWSRRKFSIQIQLVGIMLVAIACSPESHTTKQAARRRKCRPHSLDCQVWGAAIGTAAVRWARLRWPAASYCDFNRSTQHCHSTVQ